MALFRVTIKQSRNINGIRLENGMSVDLPSIYANPISSNGGVEVQNAFMRVYGIDLKSIGALNIGFLDIVKLN